MKFLTLKIMYPAILKNMIKNKKLSKVTVAISGGFDPIHIGHIRMIQAARALGDRLVVILNNDHWLRAKKGYVFMPQTERKELLKAISGVDQVVITRHTKNDRDTSVSREIQKIKPDIFANGGDRKKGNTPEVILCKQLNIQLAFNVGQGGKVQSSSWLVAKAAKKNNKKK